MRPLFLLVLLAACEEEPCADMRGSPDGLVVIEDEHGIGWGEASCDECHARDTLHRRSCTPDVDLVEVRDLAEGDAPDVCAECHGDNGVTP